MAISAVAIQAFIALGSASLPAADPFAKFDYLPKDLPREANDNSDNHHSFSQDRRMPLVGSATPPPGGQTLYQNVGLNESAFGKL